MRAIALDTETTGFSPSTGHRIIEIGCVELANDHPTQKTFQQYINPKRDVPLESFQVHGLSATFLSQFPLFEDICELFLDFIQDSPLIIHNAKFDLMFLNAELERLCKPPLKNTIIDTLLIAKRNFPGSPASLDALCRRFHVSNAHRTQHGALIDAKLLSQIYIKLSSCYSQATLDLDSVSVRMQKKKRIYREARSFPIAAEEMALYESMIKDLKSG